MADKWPLANGNWSNSANWNDGTKPVAGDVVYADGKTVTIDENVTVASVRTTQRSGGTAGGGFLANDGVILSANVLAGLTVCVTCTSGSCTILGSVTGSATVTGAYGVVGSAIGSVSIVGSVISGNYGCAVYNSGSGTIAILGDVTCGLYTTSVQNAGDGSIIITGNIFGGSYSATHGVSNTGIGTVQITGDVYGGSGTGVTCHGVHNASLGTIQITGNVTGGSSSGSNCFGVNNAGNGIVDIVGDVSAGTKYGTAGVASPEYGFVSVTGNLLGSKQGSLAVNARCLCLKSGESLKTVYAKAGSVIGTYSGEEITHYGASLAVAGQAAITDVRNGAVYGPSNELTGTCHVPGASSVLAGVPVDATVGTATIDAASIRAAVGLAAANLDAQFAAIEVNPQSIRDAMKLAPSAGAEAAGSVDAKLNAIDPLDATETQAAAAAAIAAAGLVPSSGARTCVLTVNDGANALESASVRVTKGAESYILQTNTSGQVAFNLDDGTWTVAITLANYVFTGDTLVVDGDETATYSMTANGTVPAPSTTSQCTGYGYVYDQAGAIESGVVIVSELTRMPSGSAKIGDDDTRNATSAADGLVTFTNLWIGGTYRFYRSGSSKRFAVTIDAADVDDQGRYPLPNFVG